MSARRPVRIGLTGPIGCGKSTVARWLGERGAVVIDAERRPVLIDLNDWPSFAPIRDRAARAIAGHVHAARPQGALA